MNDLIRLGWRAQDAATPPAPGQSLARVAAQHRSGYVLHDGRSPFNAQPAPEFLRRGLDPVLRPAVGDFVWVAPGSPPHILGVAPRRSLLTRAAAGERYQRQVIAANVDVVLVLMGLDGDYNPRRIQRYLALIDGSGATPVVLLTKADQHAEAASALAQLGSTLPPATAVLAINAKDPEVRALLAPWLGAGVTAALVGSSGAGKSTLTNTLLGEQRQATAAIRANDSRGRHTTTHRALLALPGGACLIDTPGMRELKLTGEENLDLYADIETLAGNCRFADCGHGNEPGCAISAALASGELDGERWRSYLKLHDEREQQAAALEQRLQHKAGAQPGHRTLGRRQREKPGPR